MQNQECLDVRLWLGLQKHGECVVGASRFSPMPDFEEPRLLSSPKDFGLRKSMSFESLVELPSQQGSRVTSFDY